jgi:hypothetical protein
MRKRANLTAWGLVAVLTVGVLIASEPLTPYPRIYRDRAAWDAFFEAARRGDYQFRVMVYLMAVTGLLFVVLDLRRVVNRWDKPSPVEPRRRQGSLVGVAAVLLVILLALMR